MINPKILCRKHLLGEHGEIHKHRHNFVKKHNMAKRVELGQIEVETMKLRHDALAEEMLRRGYNHQSPYEMPDISYLPLEIIKKRVDLKVALCDLITRCPDCKERYLNKGEMKWL